jgi:hypothetical protein
MTILDRFTLAVKKALEKLGLMIENGIAKVRELFAEKVVAKEVCLEGDDGEKVCLNKEKLEQLLEKKNQVSIPETQPSESENNSVVVPGNSSSTTSTSATSTASTTSTSTTSTSSQTNSTSTFAQPPSSTSTSSSSTTILPQTSPEFLSSTSETFFVEQSASQDSET